MSAGGGDYSHVSVKDKSILEAKEKLQAECDFNTPEAYINFIKYGRFKTFPGAIICQLFTYKLFNVDVVEGTFQIDATFECKFFDENVEKEYKDKNLSHKDW